MRDFDGCILAVQGFTFSITLPPDSFLIWKQIPDNYLLLVQYGLTEMVLAFDPVDAVCWPETQGRYIQAIRRRLTIPSLVKSGLQELFNLQSWSRGNFTFLQFIHMFKS